MRPWGAHGWAFLHACSFGYPECPLPEDREGAFRLVTSLPAMLPCAECRRHAQDYIVGGPRAVHSPRDAPFSSRLALARWVFDFHDSVNLRLGRAPHGDFDGLAAEYGEPGAGPAACNCSVRARPRPPRQDRSAALLAALLLCLGFAICLQLVRRHRRAQ